MARPTKDGLDYFPLNTKNDDKFDLIEARHGLTGFAIIIKLFQRIYDENGYFYPWGDKQKLLFSRAISTPIGIIDTIIESAVEFGLFDSERFKKGVLTSKGIQRRYFEASKKRKVINLYSDILLIIPELGEKQSPCNGVFTGNNPQASGVITGNNPQSKRESKEESSGNNPEFIPEITPQEEPENTTTFPFSKLQEEVKASTGYLIDEKVASRFNTSKIPEDWISGPESFFAFAKSIVQEKYPGKPESEQRTLFITAVTDWENLRTEYPGWKSKKEKASTDEAVKKAKITPPEICDCGGVIKVRAGRLTCEKCGAAWVFENKIWEKLEVNASAHIDLEKGRRPATRKTDPVEEDENPIPLTF